MQNDYRAAIESAAVFAFFDRGVIDLVGPDARTFLHNLCTQDINSMSLGECREAFLTTMKARVLAHVWIWHRKQDTFLLDLAIAQEEKVVNHLNRHLISEQVEIFPRIDYRRVRLVGPDAKDVVGKAGLDWVRQDTLPGQPSVDLMLPNGDGDQIEMLTRLEEEGALRGTPATHNILRIEAGLPEYGIDIDENRLAMEVNRTPQAISYNKGCYLGQETIVMARDRGQVNRLLMGIKVADDQPLAAGTKLFKGNDEVGQVTSSAFSPRLKQVIALAYLRRGSWDAGTDLNVDVPNGRIGTVCTLPFVPS